MYLTLHSLEFFHPKAMTSGGPGIGFTFVLPDDQKHTLWRCRYSPLRPEEFSSQGISEVRCHNIPSEEPTWRILVVYEKNRPPSGGHPVEWAMRLVLAGLRAEVEALVLDRLRLTA